MEVLRYKGSKSSLVIDSAMTCMQSTETSLAEMFLCGYHELVRLFFSNVNVVVTTKHFPY